MKRSSEFRYLKLAEILRGQILEGYIKPGEYIMSENELTKHYGISRSAVRMSLEQLLKEGLVVKKMGKGTMVSPDLVIHNKKQKVLRIMATSPSHYVDTCMDIMIEAFHKRHPSMEVKVLHFLGNNFWDSLHVSKEMGVEPDLVFVNDRQSMELGQSGFFRDLKPWLGPDTLQDMYPKLLDAFTRDSVMFAAPVTFSPVFLAYNPGLFDKYNVAKPTSDWVKEDFIRAAQKLTLDTDGDGIVDQYGFSLSSSFSRWPVIALQHGVNLSGMVDFESMVNTLTFIHDLAYRYRIASLSGAGVLNSEAFYREKAAMVLTTAIELAGWRNDNIPFEPLIAPLRLGDYPGTLLVANTWMIPSNCQYPELAAQFIQSSLLPDTQEALGLAGRFLSVQPSVNEKIGAEQLNLQNSSFLHEIIADPDVIEELTVEMGMYWAGMESARSFADRFKQILNRPADK